VQDKSLRHVRNYCRDANCSFDNFERLRAWRHYHRYNAGNLVLNLRRLELLEPAATRARTLDDISRYVRNFTLFEYLERHVGKSVRILRTIKLLVSEEPQHSKGGILSYVRRCGMW